MYAHKCFSPECIVVITVCFCLSVELFREKEYTLGCALISIVLFEFKFLSASARSNTITINALPVALAMSMYRIKKCLYTSHGEVALEEVVVSRILTTTMTFGSCVFATSKIWDLKFLMQMIWVVILFVIRNFVGDHDWREIKAYLFSCLLVSGFHIIRVVLLKEIGENVHISFKSFEADYLRAECQLLYNLMPLIFQQLIVGMAFEKIPVQMQTEIVSLSVLLFAILFLCAVRALCRVWYQLRIICSPMVFVEFFVIVSPGAISYIREHIRKNCYNYEIIAVGFFCSLVFAVIGYTFGSTATQSSKRITQDQRKNLLTVKRKAFHVILFIVILVIQREQKYTFSFEKFLFPIIIAVFLVQSSVWAFRNSKSVYHRSFHAVISSYANLSEQKVIRSPIYLLFGSVLPALLLGSTNGFGWDQNREYQLRMQIFAFSGFIYLGLTDVCASTFGTLFYESLTHQRSGVELENVRSKKTWKGAFCAYVGTFLGFIYSFHSMASKQIITNHSFIRHVYFFHLISVFAALCEFLSTTDDNIILPMLMINIWSISNSLCFPCK